MNTYAKIIEDSLWSTRITTVECQYPRFIHEEVLTHRDRARNSMSSRAIPTRAMIELVQQKTARPYKIYQRILRSIQDTIDLENMASDFLHMDVGLLIKGANVTPQVIGKAQKGMQTGEPFEGEELECVIKLWDEARDHMIAICWRMLELDVHKSIINRLLHPFQMMKTIITATNWNNFFRLRCHSDAEIHFQILAKAIRKTLYTATEPRMLQKGMWHLPYIQEHERENEFLSLPQISAARCARLSYLTHEGKRDIAKDIELFDRLKGGSGFGHWSPMNHPAMAESGRHDCLIGWKPLRKFYPEECAYEDGLTPYGMTENQYEEFVSSGELFKTKGKNHDATA